MTTRRQEIRGLLAAVALTGSQLPVHAADNGGFGRMDTAAAVTRLTREGSPDALATAALLKQVGSETDSGAYALAARAAAAAPQRADLAWLAVRLCDAADECDTRKVEQHLREVDPTNAAGWVGALARAQRSNDAAAVDEALTAIGRAAQFTVYFEPLVVTATRQLLALQARSEPTATAAVTMTVISVVAATVLPGSRIFSYSCQGYALQITGRLDRCRNAARTLEHADAYIVEGLGLSLQQKLWPLQSPEGHAIADRRRVFQYRLEEFSKLNVSSSKPADFPADYLEVAAAHEREQDVALVYFARARVAADPPPQWKSTQLPRVP